MKMASVSYSQCDESPREWKLGTLTLGPLNLLVGKNASGKTRTLNLINNLSDLVCGRIAPVFNSANYNIEFDDEGKHNRYELKINMQKVIKEIFEVDGIMRLQRGEGGIGKIYAEKIKEDIEFQSPQNQLAAVTRRDEIQHSFLEPLYSWGKNLHYYPFGTDFGKNALGLISNAGEQGFNHKDINRVISIFKKGVEKHGEAFLGAVKDDMRKLGYEIENIGLKTPEGINSNMALPGTILCLYVQEKGIGGVTEQIEISQGMFRALSLIIQLNYSALSLNPSCILVDDIGEGLDFERSCALIELLMSKGIMAKVQIILSTNDRFVMNKVPLASWSILEPSGSICRVHNYTNSKNKFDEFRFTGLNNFDFFSTKYFEDEEGKK